MVGKGYARFTDDDDDQGLGDTTLEVEPPTSPPAVLQETLGEEEPSTAAEQHDQQGLNLNFNNVTQEGTNPDATGGVGLGDDGGDPGGGDGGNDDLATQTGSSRWTYAAFYQWIMSNAVMLYISQFLSAWGDRMWSFTVALYLVKIQEQSLRLTAIYGLCVSASSLIFGAAIGRWVDKTPRLRAARTSLIIQNSSVLINACLLCTVLILKTDILHLAVK